MKANIIKDSEYDFYRVDPVPTQKQVEEFYAKEFYDTNAQYFNNSSLLIQQEQSDFFNSRWKDIYEMAEEFFKSDLQQKSVFDIGFGFAQALVYLKNKGLYVSGLEPSLEGVEYARQNGITAFHTGIENFDVIETKSDIVLLLNVLEHLREPKKTLRNIKEQLLTPNGLLVIDVPNDFNDFQIVADKEYNLDEWWVLPPNHINYFSHKSLQKLLKGCGYKIVNCTASFPLDLFLLFGDQYVGNRTLGRDCHNKRVNFEKLMHKHGKADKLKAFYKSLADLNLGRSVSVYATPNIDKK
jgi:SAM-dependent methyltransferase